MLVSHIKHDIASSVAGPFLVLIIINTTLHLVNPTGFIDFITSIFLFIFMSSKVKYGDCKIKVLQLYQSNIVIAMMNSLIVVVKMSPLVSIHFCCLICHFSGTSYLTILNLKCATGSSFYLHL